MFSFWTDLIVARLLPIAVGILVDSKYEMMGGFRRPCLHLFPVKSTKQEKKKYVAIIRLANGWANDKNMCMITFEKKRHHPQWLFLYAGWNRCNGLTYRRHCEARRPARVERWSRTQRPLDRREAPRSAEVSGRKTLPTSSRHHLNTYRRRIYFYFFLKNAQFPAVFYIYFFLYFPLF